MVEVLIPVCGNLKLVEIFRIKIRRIVCHTEKIFYRVNSYGADTLKLVCHALNFILCSVCKSIGCTTAYNVILKRGTVKSSCLRAGNNCICRHYDIAIFSYLIGSCDIVFTLLVRINISGFLFKLQNIRKIVCCILNKFSHT